MPWRNGFIAAIPAVGALFLPAPARADAQHLAWSTYLRSGPGDHYAVIDEIEHDTVVDVRSCNARWCAVISGRVLGYIDKDALSLPKPPGGEAVIGGAEGCFVAGQYSYRQPAPTRFCQTEPGK